MSNNGKSSRVPRLMVFAAGATMLLSSPCHAQSEDYCPAPCIFIGAPVELTQEPIGIECKYSHGLPIPNAPAQNSPPAELADVRFVHVPAGTTMPVMLTSAVTMDALQQNPVVQARVAQTVTLPTGEFIPEHTLVVGHIASSAPGATVVKFDQMQLTNGSIIPISTSILPRSGAAPVEGLVLPAGSGKTFPIGQMHVLRFNAPAQVAVYGGNL